ncbi:unnamed protein product [Amoebophrya sp. A25]|nr:unnamed protein product [Amoebophrya sp. A25]|eukprot:GSA25T00020456001.1
MRTSTSTGDHRANRSNGSDSKNIKGLGEEAEGRTEKEGLQQGFFSGLTLATGAESYSFGQEQRRKSRAAASDGLTLGRVVVSPSTEVPSLNPTTAAATTSAGSAEATTDTTMSANETKTSAELRENLAALLNAKPPEMPLVIRMSAARNNNVVPNSTISRDSGVSLLNISLPVESNSKPTTANKNSNSTTSNTATASLKEESHKKTSTFTGRAVNILDNTWDARLGASNFGYSSTTMYDHLPVTDVLGDTLPHELHIGDLGPTITTTAGGNLLSAATAPTNSSTVFGPTILPTTSTSPRPLYMSPFASSLQKEMQLEYELELNTTPETGRARDRSEPAMERRESQKAEIERERRSRSSSPGINLKELLLGAPSTKQLRDELGGSAGGEPTTTNANTRFGYNLQATEIRVSSSKNSTQELEKAQGQQKQGANLNSTTTSKSNTPPVVQLSGNKSTVQRFCTGDVIRPRVRETLSRALPVSDRAVEEMVRSWRSNPPLGHVVEVVPSTFQNQKRSSSVGSRGTSSKAVQGSSSPTSGPHQEQLFGVESMHAEGPEVLAQSKQLLADYLLKLGNNTSTSFSTTTTIGASHAAARNGAGELNAAPTLPLLNTDSSSGGFGAGVKIDSVRQASGTLITLADPSITSSSSTSATATSNTLLKNYTNTFGLFSGGGGALSGLKEDQIQRDLPKFRLAGQTHKVETNLKDQKESVPTQNNVEPVNKAAAGSGGLVLGNAAKDTVPPVPTTTLNMEKTCANNSVPVFKEGAPFTPIVFSLPPARLLPVNIKNMKSSSSSQGAQEELLLRNLNPPDADVKDVETMMTPDPAEDEEQQDEQLSEPDPLDRLAQHHPPEDPALFIPIRASKENILSDLRNVVHPTKELILGDHDSHLGWTAEARKRLTRLRGHARIAKSQTANFSTASPSPVGRGGATTTSTPGVGGKRSSRTSTSVKSRVSSLGVGTKARRSSPSFRGSGSGGLAANSTSLPRGALEDENIFLHDMNQLDQPGGLGVPCAFRPSAKTDASIFGSTINQMHQNFVRTAAFHDNAAAASLGAGLGLGGLGSGVAVDVSPLKMLETPRSLSPRSSLKVFGGREAAGEPLLKPLESPLFSPRLGLKNNNEEKPKTSAPTPTVELPNLQSLSQGEDYRNKSKEDYDPQDLKNAVLTNGMPTQAGKTIFMTTTPRDLKNGMLATTPRDLLGNLLNPVLPVPPTLIQGTAVQPNLNPIFALPFNSALPSTTKDLQVQGRDVVDNNIVHQVLEVQNKYSLANSTSMEVDDEGPSSFNQQGVSAGGLEQVPVFGGSFATSPTSTTVPATTTNPENPIMLKKLNFPKFSASAMMNTTPRISLNGPGPIGGQAASSPGASTIIPLTADSTTAVPAFSPRMQELSMGGASRTPGTSSTLASSPLVGASTTSGASTTTPRISMAPGGNTTTSCRGGGAKGSTSIVMNPNPKVGIPALRQFLFSTTNGQQQPPTGGTVTVGMTNEQQQSSPSAMQQVCVPSSTMMQERVYVQPTHLLPFGQTKSATASTTASLSNAALFGLRPSTTFSSFDGAETQR